MKAFVPANQIATALRVILVRHAESDANVRFASSNTERTEKTETAEKQRNRETEKQRNRETEKQRNMK